MQGEAFARTRFREYHCNTSIPDAGCSEDAWSSADVLNPLGTPSNDVIFVCKGSVASRLDANSLCRWECYVVHILMRNSDAKLSGRFCNPQNDQQFWTGLPLSRPGISP